MTAPLRLKFDVPCSPHRAFGLWTSRTDLRRPPGHCAPPARLINRRHLCSDPADATQVEVHFLASAPGSTRVRLEHRAWDASRTERYAATETRPAGSESSSPTPPRQR